MFYKWTRVKIITKEIAVMIIFTVLFLNSKIFAIETMLRVAFESSLPPYQFVNDRGEYVGMHIDILNDIAKMCNFRIEYVPMESSKQCLEALENGEADIVLGEILNSDNKNVLQHTEIISQSSICMITQNYVAQHIKSKINYGVFKATLQDGTIGYSYIQNMRNLRYIIVPNQVRAFQELIDKEAQILIGVRGSVLYQLKKSGIEKKYTIINNYIAPIEYTMIVKKGDNDLVKKLNNGLHKLRINGEYEKIYNKWVDEDEYVIKRFIRNTVYIIKIIIAITFIAFIFNIRLNILLKRQVNRKTMELQKSNADLENQILKVRNINELKNCMIENNPNGIIVFDRKCKVTIFNINACSITGLKIQPIGMNVFEINLVNDILSSKKDQLFMGGSTFLSEEISLKNKREQVRTYRYNIYQLFDINNNVRAVVLMISDITREIRIREQIFEKEKNRVLNQIIAGIAHEIRNPLTSIKTFVEIIPIKKNNEQFQDQLTKLVPIEIERIDSLIRNLINYAKPDNKNKEIVEINDIVKSCLILMGNVLGNGTIILNVEVEDDLLIVADKNQLKQILINIILNGFDAMMSAKLHDEKLSMDIKAWGEDVYVYIQVADEGIGMTEEEIKKAVEPFFTTKMNGTGLGLYITKQYVEENNGIMTIESEKDLRTKVTLKFRRFK